MARALLFLLPAISCSSVAASTAFAGLQRSTHAKSLTESTIGTSLAATASNTTNWVVTLDYETSDCSDSAVYLIAAPGCSDTSLHNFSDCREYDGDETSSLADDATVKRYSDECATDLSAYADEAFANQEYLRFDVFNQIDCTEYLYTNAFVLDGVCHSTLLVDNITFEETIIQGQVNTLHANGSVTRRVYSTGDCSGEITGSWEFNKSLIESGACVPDSGFGTVFSTNADLSKADSGADGQEASSQGDAGSDNNAVDIRAQLPRIAVILLIASLIM